jgi:hypothetical protein
MALTETINSGIEVTKPTIINITSPKVIII